jgi:hypothetical protein
MVFSWNKDKEEYLRTFYNDDIKVSPAILACELAVPLASLINIMRDLGIRNPRQHEEDY